MNFVKKPNARRTRKFVIGTYDINLGVYEIGAFVEEHQANTFLQLCHENTDLRELGLKKFKILKNGDFIQTH